MPKEINISDSKKNKKKEKITPKSKDIVTTPSDTIQQVPPLTEVTKPKKKFNLKEFLIRKKLVILLIIGISLVLGIVTFFYFGIYKSGPYKKPSELVNLNSEYLVSLSVTQPLADLPIPIPAEPKTEPSPINGKLFTKTEIKDLSSKRPVAVMINNHSVARPQSGLNSADVVYETLVESGITRYLAIFWSEAPKKVGPIRSARQYYLEWLSPYDPIYIYDGCASTTDPRTNACGNIYLYNIKNIATLGAWRWNDGRRYAPHNEYSSILTAWEYAKKVNWDSMPKIESWSFKRDLSSDERGLQTKVKIVFHQRLNNSGAYDVIWTYDNKSNSYFKQTGGKIDIDQETNTQVYAKNIVIQETTYTPSYDSAGRVIQATIGEGKATYLIDGKILTGTWEKKSRTDRTNFYDKDGKDIQFNRGRVWITVISRSVGKFDIIEQ